MLVRIAVAAMVVQVVAVPAAWATEKHTVVAATDVAAPDGSIFSRFASLVLNERGDVAFQAFLRGRNPEGIFAWDGKVTSVVALSGDPSSGDFAFVDFPAIDSDGSVVFRADTGIFRGDRSGLDPIMQDGDFAPGGGTFAGPAFAVSSDSHGGVTFSAPVDSEGATEGIFVRHGRRTAVIARDDTSSPIGGTFSFLGDPAIGGGGQVAFFAGVTGGSGDFGIFRGDAEKGVTAIFATNEAAPGGATFVDFGDPVINRRGQVAVVALLENGPAVTGLFRRDRNQTDLIALAGSTAPDGSTFTGDFLTPVLINDSGEVAFDARLKNGTSRGGLFRGDGRSLKTIALLGTTAPGTTGTFSSFGDMRISERGEVAFVGTLTVGVGGVDLTNHRGIWVGTSESDLRLVVRTGDTVAGRVLTSLATGTGLLRKNERSVAWTGGFAGGAAAIVLSRTVDGD